MNRALGLCACVALLVACGGGRSTLRPGAESIAIVTSLPTDATYVSVGEVSCQYGGNFGSAVANTERCRNELRNEALDLSANVIVVTTQTVGSGNCGNCVLMFGDAFQRSAPAAEAVVEGSASAPVESAAPTSGSETPPPG